jgi:hypothetical protein
VDRRRLALAIMVLLPAGTMAQTSIYTGMLLDNGFFDFWRTSVGVTVSWPIR